ncbi:hypothetical protein [Bradyrhizobium sp. CCBAU 11357]|uniref:hypothetical protein n=1 Tax=Bradyrhizobium sp. CCBAU 11357 TaxID=1630808 RepID=UPI002302211C|nr:hypothetical protein [Bradyrhizobium sp. CCBAU 11357]MDA9498153.1 hypothetical protein [Bradyrhizobium sp. CCBAU 11357]
MLLLLCERSLREVAVGKPLGVALKLESELGCVPKLFEPRFLVMQLGVELALALVVEQPTPMHHKPRSTMLSQCFDPWMCSSSGGSLRL